MALQALQKVDTNHDGVVEDHELLSAFKLTILNAQNTEISVAVLTDPLDAAFEKAQQKQISADGQNEQPDVTLSPEQAVLRNLSFEVQARTNERAEHEMEALKVVQLEVQERIKEREAEAVLQDINFQQQASVSKAKSAQVTSKLQQVIKFGCLLRDGLPCHCLLSLHCCVTLCCIRIHFILPLLN